MKPTLPLLQFVSPPVTISTLSNHIKKLVSKGHFDQTLEFYKELHVHHGFQAISFVLPSVIKACSSSQHHSFGSQLHCVASKTGLDSDTVLANSIISMYAKFSDVQSAHKVFDKMPHRDQITWNSMIYCYLQNGCVLEALEMLKEIYLFGFAPKPELLASLLSMCGKIGLRVGREIHSLVIVDERIEEKESVFLSTSLMDFYFKCNDSMMASRVFDGMKVKNEVSWTAMISGFSSDQHYEKAFALFREMQSEGVEPNRITLVALSPACAELSLLKHGKEIHSYAIRRWFELDHGFSSALMNMYSKFEESFHLAELIFKRLGYRDVVSWSSMISAYSQRGDGYNALSLFRYMMLEGIEPNSVTMLAVVSACTILSSQRHGCQIHCYIMKLGLDYDICLGNALINMYAKIGFLNGSHKIFQEMPNRVSVSWSTMISGYGLHGCGEQALKLFYDMKDKGVKPDSICFLAVLSACNHSGLVAEGQKLFNRIREDYEVHLSIEHYACLIDLLGRSGKIEDALEIVRMMPMKPSTRIWSSLVSSCKLHGRLDVAEMLSPHLIRSEPENAANYTLLNMIYAEHGRWLDIKQGREFMKLRRLNKRHGFSQIEAGN